ncbi:hypothetical protein, partial [Burkholderia pyrrocinia]|uniref:hypothetical protein n=1 Tax=Burkholderia pyrrocinia TaxID=60550 RepID=UPI002AB10E17
MGRGTAGESFGIRVAGARSPRKRRRFVHPEDGEGRGLPHRVDQRGGVNDVGPEMEKGRLEADLF